MSFTSCGAGSTPCWPSARLAAATGAKTDRNNAASVSVTPPVDFKWLGCREWNTNDIRRTFHLHDGLAASRFVTAPSSRFLSKLSLARHHFKLGGLPPRP